MKEEIIITLPPYEVETIDFRVMQNQIVDYWHDLIGTSHAFGKSKGEGAVVFVLDTTFKYEHPDLKDNILPQYAKSFTGESTDNNNQKHGDHVGGIIAGTDNQIGVIGVAPKTKLVFVRVLNGNGSGSSSGIANGIRYVADLDMGEYNNRKRVINMSLGGGSPMADVKSAMEYAVSKGVFICCAAGNSGYNGSQDSVGYPAAYDELCIAVSSVGRTDNFSNFSSGGVAVDVAAYGESIYSTYGTGYAALSGTSMATPIISGVAALVLSVWGDFIKTHKDLENFIKIHALDKGEKGEDNRYGAGVVRLKPLIDNKPDGTTPPDPVDPPTPPNPPTKGRRTLTFPLAGDFKLIWSNITETNNGYKYGTFEVDENTAMNGQKVIKIPELLVQLETDRYADDIFDEVMAQTNWYFTNRGMWLSFQDDYADATKWTIHFYVMLLKQRGLNLRVLEAKGVDEKGRTYTHYQ